MEQNSLGEMSTFPNEVIYPISDQFVNSESLNIFVKILMKNINKGKTASQTRRIWNIDAI